MSLKIYHRDPNPEKQTHTGSCLLVKGDWVVNGNWTLKKTADPKILKGPTEIHVSEQKEVYFVCDVPTAIKGDYNEILYDCLMADNQKQTPFKDTVRIAEKALKNSGGKPIQIGETILTYCEKNQIIEEPSQIDVEIQATKTGIYQACSQTGPKGESKTWMKVGNLQDMEEIITKNLKDYPPKLRESQTINHCAKVALKKLRKVKRRDTNDPSF